MDKAFRQVRIMDSMGVDGHGLFPIIGRKSVVALSVYVIGLIQNIAETSMSNSWVLCHLLKQFEHDLAQRLTLLSNSKKQVQYLV